MLKARPQRKTKWRLTDKQIVTEVVMADSPPDLEFSVQKCSSEVLRHPDF